VSMMKKTRCSSPLVVLALCVTAVLAFPVKQVTLSQSQVTTLSDATVPLTQREALATSLVLPGLRFYFSPSSTALEVSPADVGAVTGALPSEVVDTSCAHKVTAENPKVAGHVLNTSYMRFGVSNISWHGATVFADAELDADMDVASDIKVVVGKHWKIFGKSHCTKLLQKTVGISLATTGKTGLGVNFTASNASIQKSLSGSGIDLVFNFHADVVALVLSWDVTNVQASHCKIRSKVESALNTMVGSVVRIPIKL
jgi:hypothetical protein